MIKNIVYLFFAALLFSCEEEIGVSNLDTETLVVTAYLYANQPIDSIRVTKSFSLVQEPVLQVVDGLSITINDGSQDILLESIGDGYYRNLDHIVKTDRTYKIEFEYDEKIISAETFINPEVDVRLSQTTVELERILYDGGFPNFSTTQEIVDITWSNSSSDYYFVIVENLEANQDYVNEIFKEIADLEDRPEQFFRSEPEIIDFYSINSMRELRLYGTYKIVVYRLNAEYAALYETIGSSTLSIQEPPSNINNGLGIFTGVTPHTLFLEVREK